MKIQIDEMTIDSIKAFLEENKPESETLRIHIAGMGWSGPSFGLALDEQKEGDLVDDSSGLKFVIEEYIVEEFGDLMVEKLGNGYGVRPVSEAPGGGCESCSSCG